MSKVIALADEITGYTLSAPGKYFDNFAPDNNVKSTENIFTLYNEEGVRGGGVDRAYWTIAHYNMTPGGWNGSATLSSYSDKFSAGDNGREFTTTIRPILPPTGAKVIRSRMWVSWKGSNIAGLPTNL